mmetsp:Transcript_43675/g.81548  ORF Transcript_43675/g.81548 Transcript_43675/m.81548 type:complete len:93 (-) Transcript_43675:749-1027(-)
MQQNGGRGLLPVPHQDVDQCMRPMTPHNSSPDHCTPRQRGEPPVVWVHWHWHCYRSLFGRTRSHEQAQLLDNGKKNSRSRRGGYDRMYSVKV